MPYPYGMQNSPAVGAGLPGLPRRASSSSRGVVYDFFLENDSSGQSPVNFALPSGFQNFRVTITGFGGNAVYTTSNPAYPGGGGGGGCASTKDLKAAPGKVITLSVLTGGVVRCAFDDYVMTANPGTNGVASTAGVGGDASGGDLNFKGGNGFVNGSSGYGGSAATRFGPGGNASSTDPGRSSDPFSNEYDAAKTQRTGVGAGAMTVSITGSNNSVLGGRAKMRIELW